MEKGKLSYVENVSCPVCDKGAERDDLEVVLEEWDNGMTHTLTMLLEKGKIKWNPKLMKKLDNSNSFFHHAPQPGFPGGLPYEVESDLVDWVYTARCKNCDYSHQFGWRESLHLRGGGKPL